MTRKNLALNRLLSVFLCFALLVSYLPAYTLPASAAAEYELVADPSTIDGWKQFFLPENGDLSTENAGGVWTDKSVFTDSLTLGDTTISKTDPNSFLVALSAIASNMTVTGLSSAPTDTMLVLDVSNSMDGAPLVEAANQAITSLLAMSSYSRVGVVLYSGSSSSSTNSNAAVVLLPLARYELSGRGATPGKYLDYTASGEIVSVNDYVIDTATGRAPSTANVTKSVSGATYIQKGIITAMNEFIAEGNATTITDPNLGTVKRMPIMVLMSDGDPTLGDSDFTDPQQYDLGTGSSTSAALGFVSQLSAAYAKLQIEKKYDSKLLFYTLGLGIGNSSVATSVLNPDKTNANITEFWRQYNNAAVDDEILVYDGKGGSWDPDVNVTKLELEEGEVLSNKYVTQYFASNQADDLAGTFQDIIAQISLQTKYYPTLVTESEDYSGYVSFVDRLSPYMEIKDIKGIVIDNVLFSGASLASNFVDGGGALGTTENPTALGDNMVWSVMERLGLESADQARSLIGLAFQYGQFSYTDENNYSNYIGWYANAAGEFLGHWHENITTMPDPSDPTLTDETRPAYIIKSYGYLGYVDAENGISESDLMYATVQVRKEIATGEETVVFAIPASLIPVVTYNVSLNESGGLIGLTASGATSPIHFIYEAGLDESINAYNLQDTVSAAYLADNTNDDGSVNFYVSQYEVDNSTGYNAVNTYSYFNPSRQNDRYYFTENALIYRDTNDNLYEGTAKPSGTMYRRYVTYTKVGDTLSAELGYHQLTASALDTAMRTEGKNTWYVPAGNVRVNYESFNVYKGGLGTYQQAQNKTGTLVYANQPFVDTTNHQINDTGYNFIVGATLGNNGKLTMMPETGIKLSKELAEGVTSAESFSFTLTNTSDANDSAAYPAWKVDASGNGTTTTVSFSSGKATVELKAGESIYIGGMTDGQKIHIAEKDYVDYILKSINGAAAEDITLEIAENAMAGATFVNDIRAKGDLTIAKEVTHDFGATYEIPEDKSFTISVTLSGIGTANATFEAKQTGSTLTSIETDEDGYFEVTLKDDQQIEIFDLPEGTKVIVEEKAPGTGFAAQYWEDGVLGDGALEIAGKLVNDVIVVNDYTADRVFPVEVNVNGTKTIDGREWLPGDSFTFRLQRQESDGTWTVISQAVVSYENQEKSFSFDNAMDNEVYDALGSYYYQVVEVSGDMGGLKYDKTIHAFAVDVADKDMDGKLEISAVRAYQPAVTVVTQQGTMWNVQTNFVNTYSITGSSTVTVDLTKKIVNESGSLLPKLSNFQFALYNLDGTVAFTSDPTSDYGFTRMVLEFSVEETRQYILKEIVPEGLGEQWQYSTLELPVTVVVSDNNVGGLKAIIYIGDDATGATDSIAAEFTNTYDPKDATFAFDFVRKELTGRAMNAGEFTFAVYSYADTRRQNPLSTGTNDASGKVSFNNALSFDKVGVYYYDVVETGTDGKGITVDKNVYRVTVTVSDVDGQLTASYVLLTGESDEIVFKNTYTASPVTNVITGTKTLRGKTLLNGEFTFLMTAALDASGNVAANAQTWQAKNAVDGSIRFPEITYTQAGTYYYLVSEQAGSASNVGIRYDDTQFIVTVQVSDNLQGQLVIKSVTYSIKGNGTTNGIAFVNEYVPNSTTLQISGNKLLQNKPLTEDAFSFVLYASDAQWAQGDELGTAKNGADGKFTFSELTFTKAGTYYYLIKEVDGGRTVNGITYDAGHYRIRITVEDNLRGQLNATMVVFDESNIPQMDVEFVNVYQVSGTSQVTLEGEKTLTGRDIIDGEFAFEIYSADGDFNIAGEVIQTVTNTGNRFSFLLSYDAGQVGQTFYYVVKEANAGKTIDGVTYSKESYNITVKVEDNGKGGINATASIASDATIRFTNTYTAAATSVSYSGLKDLEGIRQLKENDFTFELYKANESFAIQGAALQAVQNKADGSFGFQAITLDEAGTYCFLIKENSQNPIGGVTYDQSEYHITVVVKDNGKGKLDVASETITHVVGGSSETAEDIIFRNSYEASAASVTYTGTKELEGIRQLKENDFSFAIYNADASFAIQGAALQTVQNKADGSFGFDAISLSEAKTYYFVIKENSQPSIGGVTYDKAEYHITVVVSDDENGKLFVVSNTMVRAADGKTETATEIAFSNSYTASSTSVTYSGEKTLDGIRQLKDNDFTFEIFAADEAFTPYGAALQTVQNKADGSFGFDAISLSEAKTYYFVIKENSQSSIGGVTYDKAEFHITVVVKDDENGKLSVASETIVRVADGKTETVQNISFINSYSATDATVSLGGNKILNGRPLAEGEFAFLLQAANADFQPLEGAEILKAWNDASGDFAFDALIFNAPGTYYFIATEDDTVNASRVTFDDAVFHITIVVTDDGEGKLIASEPMIEKVGSEDADSIAFTNIFTPRPDDLALEIEIDKLVQNKGTESIGPENFQFQLEDLQTGDKSTATSNTAGKAFFGLIFTELDAGKTFSYKVTEINDGRQYVTYSTMEYAIEISISLGDDNKLVASVKVNDAQADKAVCQFLNEYDYSIDPSNVPGNPDTADSGYLFLWTALLFVSGGCVAVMTRQFKKKEQE